MGTSLMSQDRMTAKKKGWTAALAWVGSGALLAVTSPILGGAGVVGAAYLTYRWFMFRAKRGMRF